MAADLDAPRACAAVDAWVDATMSGDTTEPGSPAVVRDVVDAALGLI
jgi:L-cysteine:1D-myo-inositol 2-amino-2-deoxy-alpha-D-glucopyranoside ligase